ncbi:helix-turn-helix domain-containing protein [Nocardiopsis sp. FR4]|uniref:helix-turn-helix domain-containing protein n=1 Tax=Nocardiopsis sp. FR4 TaxID=2605985 RepID=UPI00135CAC3D|nr:helix-turn-helix domain-containing protein [Nocardiopsis sp. FR4]
MEKINDREGPLLPCEVAALFRVDTKTVVRWANKQKIPSFKTPGGHRRFPRKEVYKLLTEASG